MVSIWFAVGLTIWMGFGQYIILKRFINPETKFSVSMFSTIAMILWPLYYVFNLFKFKSE